MAHASQAKLTTKGHLALARARTVLAGLRFAITVDEPGRVEAKGKVVNSANRPGMAGAGQVQIRTTDDQVTVTADLSGIRTLQTLVLVLPPLVVGVGGMVLRWTAPDTDSAMVAFVTAAAAVGGMAGWWVLGNKTTRAIDRFTRHIASGGD